LSVSIPHGPIPDDPEFEEPADAGIERRAGECLRHRKILHWLLAIQRQHLGVEVIREIDQVQLVVDVEV
jgi:hypothetical protein